MKGYSKRDKIKRILAIIKEQDMEFSNIAKATNPEEIKKADDKYKALDKEVLELLRSIDKQER